jgi:glucose-6-phosphate isomerase
MTIPWEHYLAELYEDPNLGVMIDTSRMGIEATWRAAMTPAMEHAFDAMEALEKGAIANPDEGRMVGHYWLRDPARAPSPEITTAIEENITRVETFAQGVHDGAIAANGRWRYDTVLVVGIGGSALGPQFVSNALRTKRDRCRVLFVDNTDPDGIDRTLEDVGDLSRVLTVVISKSGATKETRNGMLEIAHAYRRADLAFEPNAVAVTGEGSELDRMALRDGWRARFPMWDWVGGRTSEMSAVGLLPAALQGFDVRAMLDGARRMDARTRVRDPSQNPAAILALAWHHATRGRGERDMVVIPYKDRLELFARYLQQLVMESLGKEHDLDGNVVRQGITVYGNKGSTDQHAYVQQLRDGVDNFFVTFVEVLRDREGESIEVEPGITSGDYLFGFLEGTRRALYEKGRPSMTVTLPDVSPRTIGALIALYERAVGLYASLIRVNAYHQPGVEAGKKAAGVVLGAQAKVLSVLRASRDAMDVPTVAAAAGIEEEMAFRVLMHVSASAHHRVERVREPGSSPRFRALG